MVATPQSLIAMETEVISKAASKASFPVVLLGCSYRGVQASEKGNMAAKLLPLETRHQSKKNAQTPPVSLESCSPETVTREVLVEVTNGLSPVLGTERRMRTWKGGIRNSHTQGRGWGFHPQEAPVAPTAWMSMMHGVCRVGGLPRWR